MDEQGFRALLNYCVEGGLHGTFVAGTNSETMQLTQQERNRAIKIVLDQVNGRVIENIKALEDMGGL